MSSDPAAQAVRQPNTDRAGFLIGLGIAFSLCGAGPSCGADTKANANMTDVYCTQLKEIVAHTKNDFANLAGAQVEEGKWKATAVLPGQDTCYISKSKSINFICEFGHYAKKADGLLQSQRLLDQSQKCLGKLWVKQTALSEFFTGLADEENGRSIIFSVGQHISADEEYFVRVQIYRMFQQPLEPEAKTAGEKKPGSYCGQLKQVIASGKDYFAGLIVNSRKEAIGNRTHWLSAIQLQGWSDCWVHEVAGHKQCRYLSCSLGPYVDKSEAAKSMESVTNDSKGCLGSVWNVGRTRQTDGTIDTRITGDGDGPYVEVRQSKSLYSGAWNLNLDVLLDQESCN